MYLIIDKKTKAILHMSNSFPAGRASTSCGGISRSLC